MHEDQAGPEHAGPRSVAELERDTAWRVLRSGPGGPWRTAERHLDMATGTGASG
jgi:hypothetical protein